MTNAEVIRNLSIEKLADFLHEVQDVTVKTGHVKDNVDWIIFLNKELPNEIQSS